MKWNHWDTHAHRYEAHTCRHYGICINTDKFRMNTILKLEGMDWQTLCEILEMYNFY